MNYKKIIPIVSIFAIPLCLSGSVEANNGCIVDQGSLVFNGGSKLTINIGGTTPCSQFDELNIGQNLTINGGTLLLVLANGFVPSAGQSFPILQWATESGTFHAIDTTNAILPTGLVWDFSGLYGKNGGVVNVVSAPIIQPATPVPVPAWATGMLAGGLILLGKKTKLQHGFKKS